jgi:hypothetical protein
MLGITAFLSSCEYLEDLIQQPPAKQERTFKAFLETRKYQQQQQVELDRVFLH